MDLVDLLQRVPHLLNACVGNDSLTFKALRLVSKEASTAALQTLRSYSLVLKGGPTDTNFNWVKRLSHTHLESLTVRLTLSGE